MLRPKVKVAICNKGGNAPIFFLAISILAKNDFLVYQRINDGNNYEIVNNTCTYSDSAGLNNKRRTCLRQAGRGLLTVKATS